MTRLDCSNALQQCLHAALQARQHECIHLLLVLVLVLVPVLVLELLQLLLLAVTLLPPWPHLRT